MAPRTKNIQRRQRRHLRQQQPASSYQPTPAAPKLRHQTGDKNPISTSHNIDRQILDEHAKTLTSNKSGENLANKMLSFHSTLNSSSCVDTNVGGENTDGMSDAGKSRTASTIFPTDATEKSFAEDATVKPPKLHSNDDGHPPDCDCFLRKIPQYGLFLPPSILSSTIEQDVNDRI